MNEQLAPLLRSVIAAAVAVDALNAPDIFFAGGRYGEIITSALLNLFGE